jgi:glutathione S-transferase
MPTLTILILPGSQYVAKVLAALDWARCPYTKREVDIGKLKQQVPGPLHQVPYMFVLHRSGEEEGIPGSDNILRWVDRHMGLSRKFFPRELAREAAQLERLADDLNDYVLWFNWVNDDGFHRTIGAVVKRKVGFLSGLVNPLFLGGTRKRMEATVVEHKPEIVSDEEAMRGLVGLCRDLDDRLEGSGQVSLVAGSEDPTGGDFAVYAMLSRFVTGMGDAELGTTGSIPDLFEQAGTRRLKRWFEAMEAHHPLQFKDAPLSYARSRSTRRRPSTSSSSSDSFSDSYDY